MIHIEWFNFYKVQNKGNHLTLINVTTVFKKRKQKNTSVGEDVKKFRPLVHCWWE